MTTPHTLSREQAERFTLLLADGNIDDAVVLLAEHDVAPAWVLTFLANVCGPMLLRLTGPAHCENDYLGMRAVTTDGEPVEPPRVMQMAVAAANRDSAMVSALVGATLNEGHGIVDAALRDSIMLTVDLMRHVDAEAKAGEGRG